MCCSYWMVGYVAIFLNFLVFTAAFILFQLTSETVSWPACTAQLGAGSGERAAAACTGG